eukprot:COSAG04_NODE_1454_length_6656_cov_2.670581_7_plen_66_part_00
MIAFDAASAHHGAREDSMGQMRGGLKISHDPLHRNAAQVPAVSVSARTGAPERDDSGEGPLGTYR